MRDARHDILVEPVSVGQKLAPNRFWHIPPCNGAGSDRPGIQASRRGATPDAGQLPVLTVRICDQQNLESIEPDDPAVPLPYIRQRGLVGGTDADSVLAERS